MQPTFTIKQLSYHPDHKAVLTDINLSIAAGSYTTVVGPSGSGKSTLLRLLATLLTPTSGSILYQGQPQSDYTKPEYRKLVSYCFQQPSLFGETVADNLSFPFSIRNQAVDEQKVHQALKSVDLSPDMLTQPITELSGGEKQRVALIRNLLFPPQVLLLDEISAGLDADTKHIVHRLMEQYHHDGITILSVTHDETEISEAKDIITIKNGRLEVPHE
ncbi:ABC transporter ATP-binding protein [Paucilactobacillus sp. N302-9]